MLNRISSSIVFSNPQHSRAAEHCPRFPHPWRNTCPRLPPKASQHPRRKQRVYDPRGIRLAHRPLESHAPQWKLPSSYIITSLARCHKYLSEKNSARAQQNGPHKRTRKNLYSGWKTGGICGILSLWHPKYISRKEV